MVQLTFLQPDGRSVTAVARVGQTIMEVARANSVAGIVAECGGAAACASCQVVLDDEGLIKAGERGTAEAEVLEFLDYAGPNSRLSCQIFVTQAFDGMVVAVSPEQG